MTPSPTHRLPASSAVLIAGGSGAFVAIQSAVNGLLGSALGSPLAAAVISFGGGFLCLCALTMAFPSIRLGLHRLRMSNLPLWMYLGGCMGALMVLTAATATPVIGVALFTIALVSGNVVGGLITDAIGLSPAGRFQLSRPRIAGSALAILAIVVAQINNGETGFAWLLITLSFLVGAGAAVQASLNTHVSAHAGNGFSMSVINFFAGTVVLLLIAVPVSLAADWNTLQFPTSWWLYLGGPYGIGLVICAVIAVRHIGTLGFALGALVGQLSIGMALDLLISGDPPTWQVVTGAALAALAAWMATARRQPPRQTVAAAPQQSASLH